MKVFEQKQIINDLSNAGDVFYLYHPHISPPSMALIANWSFQKLNPVDCHVLLSNFDTLLVLRQLNIVENANLQPAKPIVRNFSGKLDFSYSLVLRKDEYAIMGMWTELARDSVFSKKCYR